MSAKFPFVEPEAPEPEPIDPCERLADGLMLHPQSGRQAEFYLTEDDPEVRKTELDALREVWCEDVYHLDHWDLTGQVVIDVGSHIGAFAVRAAYQGATVIAVEASRANWEATFLHADVNMMTDRVIALHAAVGRAAEERIFVHDGKGMGGVRWLLGEGMFDNEMVERVPGITLNQLILDYGEEAGSSRVALLKVDIEGGEYEAFGALLPEVAKRVDRIAMEYHPCTGYGLGQLVQNLLATHSVEAFGDANVGGMLYARRYGL